MASDSRDLEQLPRLTEDIVQTYHEVDTVHHLGHCPLPSYEAVIEATEDLTDILYPGYRRREGLHFGNIHYYVGDLVDRVHRKLSDQVARALRHADRLAREREPQAGPPPSESDFYERGRGLVVEFLRRIPELRRVLATDVRAAYDGDPACRSLDEVVFCYPGLEAVTTYRLAHQLHLLEVPLIPRMMTEWAHRRTGIDIHPGARIGPYFFIDHGTGVVIGESCQIGTHVKLYQGVTLGALSFDLDPQGNLVRGVKRHPTIEDRVIIYANATVLGGKTVIGHDSVIGSSVWLTHSVEPHTTVILEKPRNRMRADKPDELNAALNYQI